MTQSYPRDLDREFVERLAKQLELDCPGTDAAQERSDLMDQVSRNAVQLAAEFGTEPEKLLVKAGDVSVEVKWEKRPAVGAAVTEPGAGTPPPRAGPADSTVRYLTAPTVGVFYSAATPGARPFVCVNETVVAGQQVGIIEAMKLMIPIEADKVGRIIEVLKENGQAVEYDENLFVLAPDDTA
ncbi:hypothetical protein ALI144C_02400 [Actinosynnema sp. ALI-1.44]|uniref:acetyl-CoA carboxylase biotin carboxyl carrier protein n=1 Tax=Actinosynnema sp. ALI-1.44 TaxID=1933779 RepID=UPI00097C27A1|nr:biotin/lipoyl-containing protein [Actinosynnema sp. ALI-1.44]ONI90825.1 hypothetical protein ALI144C_02400 [Actinosynnema sp. ALI-1.44]